MRKLLMVCLVLALASTARAEFISTIFGPQKVPAMKDKVPQVFSFVANSGNATLQLYPNETDRIGCSLATLNDAVIAKRLKLPGMIEFPVSLLDGENVLSVLPKGKTGTSLWAEITTASPPSEMVMVHCATRSAEGMIAGAKVTLTTLNGDEFVTTTGIDGFCFFENIPAIGAALLEASTDSGLTGSTAVSLSTPEEYVIANLPKLTVPGPGTVSGNVLTDEGHPVNCMVSLRFIETSHVAATRADNAGHFVFEGLPLDGYYQLSVMGSGTLRSGTAQGTLADQTQGGTTDILREVVCPHNAELLNGDFELNTFGWRGTGTYGVLWKPHYFPEGDDNDTCGGGLSQASSRDVPFEGPYCGVAVSTEGNDASLAQKFKIHSDNALLIFDWVFVSVEWRNINYCNGHYDNFSIDVETPQGVQHVADGNIAVTEMHGLPISFGLTGVTKVSREVIPLRNLQGQYVDLIAKVTGSWSGDIRDSMIALADVHIINEGNPIPHSDGMWSLPRYTGMLREFQAGEILEFEFSTPGVIGTTVEMKEVMTGQSAFHVLPPFRTQKATFSKPCGEPTIYRFLIHTESDLNNIVRWEARSTWVP